MMRLLQEEEELRALWLSLGVFLLVWLIGCVFKCFRQREMCRGRRRHLPWLRGHGQVANNDRACSISTMPGAGWGVSSSMHALEGDYDDHPRYPWEDASIHSIRERSSCSPASPSGSARTPLNLVGLADIRVYSIRDAQFVHEICLSTERTIFDKVFIMRDCWCHNGTSCLMRLRNVLRAPTPINSMRQLIPFRCCVTNPMLVGASRKPRHRSAACAATHACEWPAAVHGGASCVQR